MQKRAIPYLFFGLFLLSLAFTGCFKNANTDLDVLEEKGPKWGFIDHSGKFVIKPQFRRVKQFSEGLAAADLHARWGYINRDGEWVIERQFEDVKDFSAGLAGVEKDRLWGAVDKKGVVKMPFNYLDIGTAHEVNPDAEDHAVLLPFKEESGKWGFKDFGPHGKGDIPAKYVDVKNFNDGLCPVFNGSLWGYIDNTGAQVIDYKFISASVFQNRVAECVMGDDFLWVDQIGTMAKKSRLDSNRLFFDGLALQQKRGKFVFINRTGKRSFRKKFRFADNFSEGLAVVQPVDSDKRGFIDKRGEMVVPPIYDDARAFSEQLAAVRVDPDRFFKLYKDDGTPKTPKKKPEPKLEESDDDDGGEEGAEGVNGTESEAGQSNGSKFDDTKSDTKTTTDGSSSKDEKKPLQDGKSQSESKNKTDGSSKESVKEAGGGAIEKTGSDQDKADKKDNAAKEKSSSDKSDPKKAPAGPSSKEKSKETSAGPKAGSAKKAGAAKSD